MLVQEGESSAATTGADLTVRTQPKVDRMKSAHYTRRSMLIAVGGATLAAIVVGCGGTDSRPTAPPTRAAQPAATVDAVEQNTVTEPTTAETAVTGQAQTGGELFTWDFAEVDEGAKASVAVDADGAAQFAYMLEAMPSWIKYARRDGDGWNITQVTEGYFYGPLSMAVDGSGTPRIIWHDHQSNQFNPELGDQALATLRDGSWVKEFIENSGHDGWDNSIALDSAGGIWTASINPSEFGATTAVFVSHFDGSGWSVESIGSPAMTYKFGTTIAVDSQNRPHVAFYNEKEQALNYATRDGADWKLVAVDGDGDTGKFASIAIDPDDNPRISHYAQNSPNGGEVRYSVFDGSEWSTSTIGEIAGVDIGFIGARNLTQLQLDGEGRPVVAYSGSDLLRVARLEGSEWTVQTVVERGGAAARAADFIPVGRRQDGPHRVFRCGEHESAGGNRALREGRPRLKPGPEFGSGRWSGGSPALRVPTAGRWSTGAGTAAKADFRSGRALRASNVASAPGAQLSRSTRNRLAD